MKCKYSSVLITIIIFASTVISAAGQSGTLVLSAVKVEEDRGVAVYDVVYWSDGLKVKGKLFENVKRKGAKLPGVVFNHGGVGGIPTPTVARCKEFAREGYHVIAPSYRGEDGSEGEIEVAAGEVDDALNAAAVLRAWPGVDPRRMAMVGTSHGGIISLLAVQRQQGFRAVVCAYGVTNTYTWYKYLIDNGVDVGDPLSLKVYGKGPQDKPEAFAARAPALNANLTSAPVLLLYGEKDKTVPVSQGREMARALKKADRPYDFVMIPGADHGFLFTNNPKKHSRQKREQAKLAWDAMLDFLRDNI